MEMALIMVVALVALIIMLINNSKRARRRQAEQEAAARTGPAQRSQSHGAAQAQAVVEQQLPRVTLTGGRHFTLAELRGDAAGRYSWDDSGCVFEVNSDGSVTVVGNFDPAELNVDPVREMYDRLKADGLEEMLPRIWSYHAYANHGGERDTYVAACVDDMLSLPVCPDTLDGVKDTSFAASSYEGGRSVITYILSRTCEGVLVLMPCNEKEYIFALGAQACISRAFGRNVTVCITHPATMAALGIAVSREERMEARITFAFGEDDDYLCCTMATDGPTYDVKSLAHQSVIQPTDVATAHPHIARGCLALSLIEEGKAQGAVFKDMLPYPMSLVLRDEEQVVKVHDVIGKPVTVPCSFAMTETSLNPRMELAFFVGSFPIIDDMLTDEEKLHGSVTVRVWVNKTAGVGISVLDNRSGIANNTARLFTVGEYIG